MNMENNVRGRFARMVVYVNLDEPLISQVLVTGKVQRVEYEFLPIVCFHFGRYGHIKEMCPTRGVIPTLKKSIQASKPFPRDLLWTLTKKTRALELTGHGCWWRTNAIENQGIFLNQDLK